MTTSEAAKAIGCSRQHVCTLIKKKKLKGKLVKMEFNGQRYDVSAGEVERFKREVPVGGKFGNRGFPRGKKRG